MAVYKTGDAIGERESLANTIERIDPSECPLYSNAKKQVVKGVFHEWQVQELASASASNHQNEGLDFSYVNPTATTRLGNYCQISANAGSVSGTLDSVDKAGRDRETAYVKVLKGLEQKRDIEKYLFSNTARSGSDPRKTASLPTWITNADFSTAGSTSAVATGDGSDTATMTGDNRALTLALIDNAMELAYTDGGNPDMLVMSPKNKVAFSDLSSGSVVTNQLHMTAPKEMSIIGSASLYLTDFGELSAVIDRHANDTEIYLLDSDHYAIGHLPNRMMKVVDVAPTGDATKFSILSEWNLIISAPKAHGAVYDLSTS